jgi:hypothetical protein
MTLRRGSAYRLWCKGSIAWRVLVGELEIGFMFLVAQGPWAQTRVQPHFLAKETVFIYK